MLCRLFTNRLRRVAWKTEGASGSESAEETVCDGNEVTEVAEEDGCQ